MTEEATIAGRPRAGLRRELLSFAAIGVAGLLVDMAALWVALELLGLGLYAGRVFSYLCAATFTWAMNRRFTFASHGRANPLRQWLAFLAANAVGGLVNYGTYAGLVGFGPALLPLPGWALALLPYAATAAGSVAGMGFNFAASKWLVFRRM